MKINTIKSWCLQERSYIGYLGASITGAHQCGYLSGQSTVNEIFTLTRFKFLFLAVRRADMKGKPHKQTVISDTYRAARQIINADFIAVFAGKVPVQVIHHV